MKKITYILLGFAICSQFVIGQTASFMVDTTMGCDSLRVTFTNTSTPDVNETLNDYDFYWSFERNHKRDVSPFTYLFQTHGIDTIIKITLTMRHKEIVGKESRKTDSIRLRPTPNAWFKVIDHPLDTLVYTFQSGKAPSDTIVYQYVWHDLTANRILGNHANANDVETIDNIKYRRDKLVYTFTSNEIGYRSIQLTVSDWYGCSDRFDSTILINRELVVPKFFTPNGDGINDFLLVETNGKDSYKIEIFNSRGQRVFHSISKNIIWDGIIEISGQPAPSGTYYYYIQSQSGVPAQVKGFFVLLKE